MGNTRLQGVGGKNGSKEVHALSKQMGLSSSPSPTAHWLCDLRQST